MNNWAQKNDRPPSGVPCVVYTRKGGLQIAVWECGHGWSLTNTGRHVDPEIWMDVYLPDQS